LFTPHAAGGVYDTLAPTRIGAGIMGEAGGETVAILANPRRADAPAGSSNRFNIHLDLLTLPRNGDQVRHVVAMLMDEIDEKMAIRADNAPVGLRGFGGGYG
jgi:hypothetical protein